MGADRWRVGGHPMQTISAGETITFKSIGDFCAWMDANGYEIMRWVDGKIILRRCVGGNLYERLELERNDGR